MKVESKSIKGLNSGDFEQLLDSIHRHLQHLTHEQEKSDNHIYIYIYI